MLIGQLAKRTGLSRDTIRYYERLGLLASPQRTSTGGYKVYGPDSLGRLTDIAQLKKSGFTLREIRQLAEGTTSCRGLPDRVLDKIQDLDRALAELTAQRASLKRVERTCNEQCPTTRGLPDCVLPVKAGCCG